MFSPIFYEIIWANHVVSEEKNKEKF